MSQQPFPADASETNSPASGLDRMLAPRGVVLVGASSTPGKLGHRAALNLIRSGYGGAIHFVNPHGGALFDRPVYRQISEVPDPVDLAVLLVASRHVPDLLAECGRRRICGAIVASGGFGETGPIGADIERRLCETAKLHDIRVLGPNCIGIIDTHQPLDTTFLASDPPRSGSIGLVSQSGAICAAYLDWMASNGLGLSRMVSVGNKSDVTEADLLPGFSADAHTDVVTMYVESIGDGRRFVEAASALTRLKPMVALKVGRSEVGRHAAASHTGALAGSEAAVSAAFRRAGIIRADSTGELFEASRALSCASPLAGKGVAVLTNAGGPGVATIDAFTGHELELAELGPSTRVRLATVLPPAAVTDNPVDMLASATPQDYATCLDILLRDEAVHAAVVIVPPPPTTSAEEVLEAITSVIHGHDKPVAQAFTGGPLVEEALRRARTTGLLAYRYPEEAAAALGTLRQRSRITRRIWHSDPLPDDIDADRAMRTVESCPPGSMMSMRDALAVAACYRLPLIDSRVVDSIEEAVAAADQIGYPVVLKLVSRLVVHKAAAEGVVLGIGNRTSVRRAVRTLFDRAKAMGVASDAGVLVQPMAPDGMDVVVGATQDPSFGPLVMVGGGGTGVEFEPDVSFGLAPVSRSEVAAMLEETRIGRRMHYGPASDRLELGALIDVVVRVSRLAADLPELTDIDFNPVRMSPGAPGAAILDVRMRRADACD